MSFSTAELPVLGAGLGYRAALHEQILAAADRIDWLEVISDHFMPLAGRRAARLAELAGLFPCVPHSLELSVASAADPPAPYAAGIAEVARAVAAPWFSDHLAFSRLARVTVGAFMPPFRDRATAARIAARVRALQQATGRVMLLENVASLLDPGGDLDEPAFLNLIAEQADCGILLDLANLHSRCLCTGWDTRAFLRRLDLGRVVQVHLAGGRWQDGYLIDSHDQPVGEHVWDLLADVCRRTELKGVLLERDAGFGSGLGPLLGELSRARAILASPGRGRAATSGPALGGPARPAERLDASSQADLERQLDEHVAGPAPGPAGERLQDFLDDAAASRMGFIAATFPATLRVAQSAAGPGRAVARGFFRQRPRRRDLEDQLGVRAAEAEQFRRYAADLAAEFAAPELGTLAGLESEFFLAGHAAARPAAAAPAGPPGCGCRDGGADGAGLVLCPQARLVRREPTRLVTLPFDAVRVRDELLADPAPDLPALRRLAGRHARGQNLAIAVSPAGTRSVFRLGPSELAVLASPDRYHGELAGPRGSLLRLAVRHHLLAVRHGG
jgi:uncharacterized protein